MDNCEPSILTVQHNRTSVESSNDIAVLLNNFFEYFNKSSLPLSPDYFQLNLFAHLPWSANWTAQSQVVQMIYPLGCSKGQMLLQSHLHALNRLFNLSLLTACFPELALFVPPTSHSSSQQNPRASCIIYKQLCLHHPISYRGFLLGRSTSSALLTVTHDRGGWTLSRAMLYMLSQRWPCIFCSESMSMGIFCIEEV